MEWKLWVTEESVAGGKVRYWPLNRHGGWLGGVKQSKLVCVYAAGGRCAAPINNIEYSSREETGKCWFASRACSRLCIKICLWVNLLRWVTWQLAGLLAGYSVTWNKIPPNDNIQFQLCQRVLSAPVQSPSKTKGEGAWRGNSSFLLLWHVVTWTP